MPNFYQKKTFLYSAQKIHEMVMDIEKYPEFLPWCKQAKIIEVVSNKNLRADLLVNFKNFFEKYRSNVVHGKTSEGVYFIETQAIEGPFKKLFSSWKIKQLEDNKCEVEFFIEFEFSSFILGKMIGSIFEKASLKMMQSFEDRAQALFKVEAA